MSKISKISSKKAVELINKSEGKVFTATFIKKDGSIRSMNCRKGVRSHLKGGELAYDPKEYSLISVFDMQSKGYRMINAKTLISLSIQGEAYEID